MHDSKHELLLAKTGLQLPNAVTFGVYEDLMAHQNAISPQFQGLDSDEHYDAMTNPDVAFSYVEVESDNELVSVPVPQLSPVEVFPWLNKPHYENRFPGAEIRHLQHFEGVQPSRMVGEEVLRVAQADGYIIFDYPESYADYPTILSGLLSSVGVEIEEVMEIGTQTYFAGKIGLKNGVKESEPVRNMQDTFSEMQAGGIKTGKAKYESIIDPEQAVRMDGFYDDAFQVLNEHPCRQGLTTQEFLETMSNPQIAKLTYEVEGETATVCVLGDDLDEYPWVNKGFYNESFPDEYTNKQILYFPALATDPDKQGERNTEKIVGLIAEMLERGNNEAIIAFDCCDVNVGMLDVFLEMMINDTPECSIKFETIGKQIYGAFKIKPKSSDV